MSAQTQGDSWACSRPRPSQRVDCSPRPPPAKGAGIRLLTFTSLYPHAGLPNQGVFVENRLRHLVGTGEVTSTVLAPVPWFPSRHERFGAWSRHARAERHERRHGLEIHHPRFAVIPRVGMNLAPSLLAVSGERAARRLQASGLVFDLIDAHYLYPDGVAAVRIGRVLGLPVVMTARGSDVTEIPGYKAPRRKILDAVAAAAAVITVSAGLRDALVRLGADAAKITVLRNGVDLQGFHPPADRAAARRALGITRPALLSVGHLIGRKGHARVIEALQRLPDHELLIVGEGPDRGRLESLARDNGRVRLLGARPHAELPAIYGAADTLVLASDREGWANVLLESMACGTPVVASDIPGNTEVVLAREAGLIVPNTPQGIADGVSELHARPPGRADTRAYAEQFSWEATSRGQIDIFRRALNRA